MNSALEERLAEYIRTHRDDGILLDTNVLVLLLAANFDKQLVGGKRLEKYAVEDAELLTQYVACFDRVLTTPHILAETSNLAAQILSGKQKKEFFARLFPLFCSVGKEALWQCQVSDVVIDQPIFVQLGLTDAVIAATVDANRLLLTDDLDLHLAACSKGAPSINFTHMREAAGLL